MKCKKVISLITTLAMCISMFSAFSVTSFAENDNTYSCDFTSLVKNNADTARHTVMEVMYHLLRRQTEKQGLRERI